MLESLNEFKVVIVALNLLVFYYFMKKFLFKPITDFMEKRTNSIRDSIENAEKANADALDLKTNYEGQLKQAITEGEQLVEESRLKAESEYERILTEARLESENLLAKAKVAIEYEKEKAFKDIRNQVVSLALAAATKIIEHNMDTETNRILVDKFYR